MCVCVCVFQPLPAPKMMRGPGPNATLFRVITCEDHVISAFLLTDILLLASYIFGLYLFSREETEYLSNLASKVGAVLGSGYISNLTRLPK